MSQKPNTYAGIIHNKDTQRTWECFIGGGHEQGYAVDWLSIQNNHDLWDTQETLQQRVKKLMMSRSYTNNTDENTA